MATLDIKIDPDAILKEGEHSEEMLLRMIEAGQKVMVGYIRSGATKYTKTGDMANSVKPTKPVIDRNGNPVGRVKFMGDDRNGMSNSAKAMWIEYGTTKRSATPFVGPAIESSKSAVYSAMKSVEQREMNK
jgi:hypothetical protein